MRKLLISIIIILAIVLGVYLYVYQGHRDVSQTDSSITLTTDDLISTLTDGNEVNDKELLDAVITVKGTVSMVSGTELVMDKKVFIELSELNIEPNIGDKLSVKGRCLGYDDLLDEVKIDQAIILD